jgi:serine/threonine-protein kinase RsbT
MSTSLEASGSERAIKVLGEFVSPVIARSIMRVALRRRSLPEDHVGLTKQVLHAVIGCLDLYLTDPRKRSECAGKLQQLIGEGAPRNERVLLAQEGDIVEARTAARRLAEQVGFGRTDQVKISTAVSELSRNAVSYAGGGEVQIAPLGSPRPGIRIQVADSGPGIANLAVVLSGTYSSKTGLGLGILGCKRLMDQLDIDTQPGRGTRISMTKYVS